MKIEYKYKVGDVVKHKAGGPKMIIVDKSWYWEDWQWCDGEPTKDEYKHLKDIGYLCRFFIPKNADINVANATAYNHSSSSARATGQGSYETRHFFEFELII